MTFGVPALTNEEIGTIRQRLDLGRTIADMDVIRLVATMDARDAEVVELRRILALAGACSISVRGKGAGAALKFMRAYDAYQETQR